mmetsp:Transcript_126376/g.353879  ORF Transcript_126376/g.353879 Transcript_126376/m.353879 type:complete len:239 (+) Transcript_126376:811-1527(+)
MANTTPMRGFVLTTLSIVEPQLTPPVIAWKRVNTVRIIEPKLLSSSPRSMILPCASASDNVSVTICSMHTPKRNISMHISRRHHTRDLTEPMMPWTIVRSSRTNRITRSTRKMRKSRTMRRMRMTETSGVFAATDSAIHSKSAAATMMASKKFHFWFLFTAEAKPGPSSTTRSNNSVVNRHVHTFCETVIHPGGVLPMFLIAQSAWIPMIKALQKIKDATTTSKRLCCATHRATPLAL